METKKVKAIRGARRRADKQRLAVIHERIAAGDIASLSNDTKWEKVLSELAAAVDRDAPVSVKLIDSDGRIDCSGLLNGHFEKTYVEFHHGLLQYVFIEWLSVQTRIPPQFSYQVEHEFDGQTLKVFGYRRLGRGNHSPT